MKQIMIDMDKDSCKDLKELSYKRKACRTAANQSKIEDVKNKNDKSLISIKQFESNLIYPLPLCSVYLHSIIPHHQSDFIFLLDIFFIFTLF